MSANCGARSGAPLAIQRNGEYRLRDHNSAASAD
jgi:hypothetical protein